MSRNLFISSVGWVTSSFLIAQTLRLIQGIIIARWLGPEEIGLYAYVFSILTLIELFEQIGANQVFIARSPSTTPDEAAWLSSCWTVRILLACCVGLTVIVVGTVVTTTSDGSRIAYLLLLLSPIPILRAAQNAQLMLLHKRQMFPSLARFEIAAAMIRMILPLSLVYEFGSIEWLVIANVAASAIVTILSYGLFPARISFRLAKGALEELIFFGRNNIVISILTAIHTTLDNIAVGAVLGRETLGLYSLGYRLGMTPLNFIQSVSGRIITPRYRIARDVSFEKMAGLWRLIIVFLALLYASVFAPIIALSDWGVELVFGAQWNGLDYVIVFSAFIAFFRGITLSISPLMTILGVPHIDARLKWLEVGIFLLFVAIGSLLSSFQLFLWGGVISYGVAFTTRALWWHRTLINANLTGVTRDILLHLLLALAVLLTAVTARWYQANIVVTLLSVLAVLAVPLIRSTKNIVRGFAE